jgi:hypothetical protein
MKRRIAVVKPTHDYVARRKCGCIGSIMYDLPTKDVAAELRRWASAGLTIERMPIAEAVAAFKANNCTHGAEWDEKKQWWVQPRYDNKRDLQMLKDWNEGKARQVPE